MQVPATLVKEMFDLTVSAREKIEQRAAARRKRNEERVEEEFEAEYRNLLNVIKETAGDGRYDFSYAYQTGDCELYLSYQVPMASRLQKKLTGDGFRAELVNTREAGFYRVAIAISWDLHAVYGY